VDGRKMESNNNNNDELMNYISFNQDYGCFACGTNSGFAVFNTDPMKCTTKRSMFH
jgi:hypothetical protein